MWKKGFKRPLRKEEPLGFKTLHYLGGMEVLLRIRGEKRRVAAFIL